MTAERSETEATKEPPQGEREGWRERVKIIGISNHEGAPPARRLDAFDEPFVEHFSRPSTVPR